MELNVSKAGQWDIILDEAPKTLRRHLQVIDGVAYATTRVYLKGQQGSTLVTVGSDGGDLL
jgi:hypothetical protein